MKKFFVYFLICFFFFPILNCYGIKQDWEKNFGGDQGDYGFSVDQTINGGYIIAGYTSSFNAVNDDFYLIYCDPSGNLLWNKTYGGLGRDLCNYVIQTIDGGYILVGFTTSFGAGSSDVYLVKTDSVGKMQFNYTYGGNNIDAGSSVQQTSDGGYVIVGYTWSFNALASDVYLIKTDIFGNLAWQQRYGGTKSDYGLSVQQTPDGGYIIAGSTDSFGAGDWASDFYLIKTDYLGRLQWNKTYTGLRSDLCYSVIQASDGGYVLAGSTSLPNVSPDVYIIKTDSTGQLEWNRNYGGMKGEGAYSIQQIIDGGYIISGFISPPDSAYYNVYLFKIDSFGNMLWNITSGGIKNDVGYSVHLTSDGGAVVAGYTNSNTTGNYDVNLIKYSDVSPNQIPHSAAGPDKICYTGEIVIFDGSNSTDIDGSITSYHWDFGDGTETSPNKITNHTYQNPDIYRVMLTVIDNKGASGTDNATITVNQANKAPTADAGLDKTCTVGSIITLDGSNSTDTDGTIISYSWDFGDTTPIGKGKISTHTYSSSGIYTVTLIVTDDKGETAIDKLKITVTKAPTNGSIKIYIKDSSNKPITGVMVSSTTQPTGQTPLSTETGSEGFVLFSNLLPGSYIFSVTKSGYTVKTETVTSILDQIIEKTMIIEAQQQGIPGYSYETIVISIIIVIVILNKRKI